MDIGVNHYEILGLVGVEPSKVSKDEITKAYKLKAKEVHPDKRPHDPINANAMFVQLQNSYELLKDDKARKLFDDHLLRLSKRDSVLKREKVHRQGRPDPKRRKMMSELQEREHSAFSVDPSVKAREEEEERTFRQLQQEIARVAAMHNAKRKPPPSKQDRRGGGSDNDKVLKVSWKKDNVNIGGEEDYTAQRLREIFGKFGPVEGVVLCKKKGSSSALVEMASRDAAVAATRNVLSDCSNRLRVELLQPAAEKNEPKVVSFGEDFENSVLKKMMKLAKLKNMEQNPLYAC